MVGIRIVFLFLLFIGRGLRGQTHQFTSFDGTTLVFTDEGEGKPVLLIHGFINTRKSWEQTVLKKDLLAKGYRVIIPDLRGNGDSDKPQDDKAYSNDAEVRDLMLLIDHLKITKYKAVGYSRGSIVLAKLLTQDKRVKKAVLGGMGIDFTLPDWNRRMMFAAAFAGDTNEFTQGAVDYARSIHADLHSLHLQQKYQPVASLKELAAIRKKVLVIAGDKDVDNGDPRELQRAIPKAKLKIVGGDHNGTYKTSDFSKAVLTFLN
ncbi:alpha/beta hydrolase [Maribacter polysiphoniae]|uniref:Alpha/beta hydrolase n=1 Tax=Maribacter polysiphoniae TaxID=429344 RepID=A0A316DZK6_9FLAO|nr:alpha/beta hydrolase [Maribacter polysiphoniae]MBD1261184.1 alpha/beta hydrolase [Maribacter polysiphoniae]PWK23574.1 pimeloyl-ACP methyl ester carboxylesterase [Maribacter polysiphoniae]